MPRTKSPQGTFMSTVGGLDRKEWASHSLAAKSQASWARDSSVLDGQANLRLMQRIKAGFRHALAGTAYGT